ncbi:hypothetical protein ACFL2R_00995 [Patescibacteria group bacterium]
MIYGKFFMISTLFIFLILTGCTGKSMIPIHVSETPVILEDNKISTLKTGYFIALKNGREKIKYISTMSDFVVFKDAEIAVIRVSVFNPESVPYQVWTKTEFLDDLDLIMTSGKENVKVRYSTIKDVGYNINLPREPRGKYVRFWVALRNNEGQILKNTLESVVYYLSFIEKGGGFTTEEYEM